MGAIAGVFHPGTPKPVDPVRIAAMIAAQAHRGPDGEGLWTGAGVGLGHCRLAVTDVAGSPQPMRAGALCVSFDGELYNLAELRTELARKGARFRTRGDAEVLLHGWRAWGAGMLDRLDGMFGLALHDADAGCLLLARDRLGIKPLHYVELADGSVAFASELKGLLAHPQLRRTPDMTAIDDYLAFGYVPDDNCLVAGVRKLPAAHALLIERGRALSAPRRYWTISFADRAGGTPAALGEALLQHMRDAVCSRMTADVPPGAFLSGDIDSAAVVALMAEASKTAVKTCAVMSEEGADGARLRADAVAARFATDHDTQWINLDDVTPLDTIAYHLDEPFADRRALSTYQIARLARQRMTVALSGAGSDAVLAGDPQYRRLRMEERARRLVPLAWRHRVSEALSHRAAPAGWAALARGDEEAYAHAVTMLSPGTRSRLFSPAARAALDGRRAEDRYVAAMRAAPARDMLDRAQYADLTIRLPARTLVRIDRMSMAVGLETRVPLLDHRLVEFGATLPGSLRIRRGEGKWLMRRSLAAYLPRDIVHGEDRRTVAVAHRQQLDATSASIEDLIRSRILADSGWFHMPAIGRFVEGHRAGRGEYEAMLWQILMLERSLRHLFG